MTKVGYVCTNYNNAPFTRAAVASLVADGDGRDVRVVVVDNNSSQDDVAALEAMGREFPGVQLVLNQENVGYFPGLNIGLHHLKTRFPDIEHVVVGNNDLTFPEDFVDVLQRHRDVFETWAVVAPDLVTLDGVHQNPHVLYPISKARKLVWDLYYQSYSVALVIRYAARIMSRFTAREENAFESDLYKTAGPIEQGYGACYLLGPVFFKHFDGLCAPTFLMHEEFFLYEQLKRVGQMTYYDPRFIVYHHTHATMGRLPSHRHWMISRESHRVYKRYMRLSPTERLRMIDDASRAST